jgi:hypothetical protein
MADVFRARYLPVPSGNSVAMHGYLRLFSCLFIYSLCQTKCTRYWPDDKQMIKTFGKYNVMLKEEEHTANYIFREMKVWKDGNVSTVVATVTFFSFAKRIFIQLVCM